jgi:hypothetical protein
MKKSEKKWPGDYLGWSGSFDDLVQTTAEVMALLDPEAKAPTASLMRHYQQINTVGKGERVGRSSRFSFRDLSMAVATKGLVKNGIGLNMVSSLVSNSSPAVLQAYSSPAQSKTMAEQTVSDLMAGAGLASPLIRNIKSLSLNTPTRMMGEAASYRPNTPLGACGGMSIGAAVFPQTNSMPDAGAAVDRSMRMLQPAPWLTMYIDDAALALADTGVRESTADTLELLAVQLRQH